MEEVLPLLIVLAVLLGTIGISVLAARWARKSARRAGKPDFLTYRAARISAETRIDRLLNSFCGNVGIAGSAGHAGSVAVAKPPGTRGLLAEHPDPQLIVHALAAPTGGGGVAIDANAQLGMRVPQFVPRVGARRRTADHLVMPPVRTHEAPAALRLGLDSDLSLMHQTMV